jgi:nucleoid-associated protein YgaU
MSDNYRPLKIFSGLAAATALILAGLTYDKWYPRQENDKSAETVVPVTIVPEPQNQQAAEQPAAGAEATAPATMAEQASPPAAGEQQAATEPQAEPQQQPSAEQQANTDQQANAEPPASPPATETSQPESAAAPREAPEFDTVRVEPSGEAIVAGTATPGSEVTLKLNGNTVGRAVANADGAWVVVPEQPLAPGTGELSVEQKAPGSAAVVTSEQTVAVAVPEAGSGKQPMVAILEPDAPSKVLQVPEAAPAENATTVEKQPEPPAATAEQAAPQETAAAEPKAPQPEAPAPSSEPAPAQPPAAETTPPAPAQPPAPAETPPAAAPEPAAPQESQVAAVQPSAEPQAGDAAPPQPAAEPAPAAAPQPAPSAQPAPMQVVLDSVDYNDRGDIIFSGRAGTGATVRIYVDNRPIGDAASGADGRWTYVGRSEISPGAHSLRVDHIDSSGKVVNRIELPFMREEPERVVALNAPKEEEPPAATAAEGEPAQQPAAPSAESNPPAELPAAPAAQDESPSEAPAPPAAASSQTQKSEVAAAAPAAEPAQPKSGRVIIQPGNNLWKLSRVIYGGGRHYTIIYQANRDQIRNPDLIYPGQIFTTPQAVPPEEIDPKRRKPLTPEEGGVTLE